MKFEVCWCMYLSSCVFWACKCAYNKSKMFTLVILWRNIVSLWLLTIFSDNNFRKLQLNNRNLRHVMSPLDTSFEIFWPSASKSLTENCTNRNVIIRRILYIIILVYPLQRLRESLPIFYNGPVRIPKPSLTLSPGSHVMNY